MVGDVFVEANRHGLRSVDDAKYIVGPHGTKVELVVQRAGIRFAVWLIRSNGPMSDEMAEAQDSLQAEQGADNAGAIGECSNTGWLVKWHMIVQMMYRMNRISPPTGDLTEDRDEQVSTAQGLTFGQGSGSGELFEAEARVEDAYPSKQSTAAERLAVPSEDQDHIQVTLVVDQDLSRGTCKHENLDIGQACTIRYTGSTATFGENGDVETTCMYEKDTNAYASDVIECKDEKVSAQEAVLLGQGQDDSIGLKLEAEVQVQGMPPSEPSSPAESLVTCNSSQFDSQQDNTMTSGDCFAGEAMILQDVEQSLSCDSEYAANTEYWCVTGADCKENLRDLSDEHVRREPVIVTDDNSIDTTAEWVSFFSGEYVHGIEEGGLQNGIEAIQTGLEERLQPTPGYETRDNAVREGICESSISESDGKQALDGIDGEEEKIQRLVKERLQRAETERIKMREETVRPKQEIVVKDELERFQWHGNDVTTSMVQEKNVVAEKRTKMGLEWETDRMQSRERACVEKGLEAWKCKQRAMKKTDCSPREEALGSAVRRGKTEQLLLDLATAREVLAKGPTQKSGKFKSAAAERVSLARAEVSALRERKAGEENAEKVKSEETLLAENQSQQEDPAEVAVDVEEEARGLLNQTATIETGGEELSKSLKEFRESLERVFKRTPEKPEDGRRAIVRRETDVCGIGVAATSIVADGCDRTETGERHVKAGHRVDKIETEVLESEGIAWRDEMGRREVGIDVCAIDRRARRAVVMESISQRAESISKSSTPLIAEAVNIHPVDCKQAFAVCGSNLSMYSSTDSLLKDTEMEHKLAASGNLQSWLAFHGLLCLDTRLAERGFHNVNDVLCLTEDQLDDIVLSMRGIRSRLMAAIEDFKDHATLTSSQQNVLAVPIDAGHSHSHNLHMIEPVCLSDSLGIRSCASSMNASFGEVHSSVGGGDQDYCDLVSYSQYTQTQRLDLVRKRISASFEEDVPLKLAFLSGSENVLASARAAIQRWGGCSVGVRQTMTSDLKNQGSCCKDSIGIDSDASGISRDVLAEDVFEAHMKLGSDSNPFLTPRSTRNASSFVAGQDDVASQARTFADIRSSLYAGLNGHHMDFEAASWGSLDKRISTSASNKQFLDTLEAGSENLHETQLAQYCHMVIMTFCSTLTYD